MLIHLVCLQLTPFFLITSIVLWIEQLFAGPIASLANKQTVYLGIFVSNGIVSILRIITLSFVLTIAVVVDAPLAVLGQLKNSSPCVTFIHIH